MTRLSREDFVQALERVEAGRSNRNFLEQSSCFVFRDGYICTFNDEVCCRTKFDLPPDFVGAVPGKPLMDVLRNMSDDEITLSVDGTQLVIKGRRKESGLRLEAEILLPVDSVESPQRWVPLENPEEFAAAVKQVCGAAGTNEEEFMSVCVHIAPACMESTDRNQASKYDTPTGVSRDFLVRAKSLAAVAPLGVTKVGETENWVHFRNKAVIISIRRHLESYFDLAKVWAFRGTEAELPRGAEEAARLGAVFSAEDKENNKVTVALTDGHMRVRGEGAHGWATADLEMAYHGAPVSFRIAPDMLEQLVKQHTRVEIGPGKIMVRGERWCFVSVTGSTEPAKTEPEVPTDAEAGDEPADEE